MVRAATKAAKVAPAKPKLPDPAELATMGESLPDVLLSYQRKLLEATAMSQVVVVEKSRRIGATWGFAADAVLTSASAKSNGGMDTFYIGFNLDMTKEFIDVCAMWARAFMDATATVGEFLFEEQDEDGADRAIKAFRITFASGYEIVALCSRPRSLRGRQGYVIIDEAAFHDELAELLKAAMALLIWGGKVLVISTHNGADNPYAVLVEDCRAGRKPYALVRTTFDDALADGLYQRVCLTTGKTWSAETEVTWAASIRDFYGDGAAEELDCIPRQSGGKYFPQALLEARSREVPVLRWECDAAFVDAPEERRIAECLEWCTENIAPLLTAMPRGLRSFLGEDFGRSADLTILWPLLLEQNLVRRTPFLIELRNVPFRQQEQVTFYLCDGMPGFSGGAFDARGNGQFLAEVARQRYGSDCIAEVMLSEGWYRENMAPAKAALEDETFLIPRDADVVADFRAIEVVRGVPRIVERTKDKDGKGRHGDAAIAGVLAHFASRQLDVGPIRFSASGETRTSLGGFAGDPELDRYDRYAGWN